MSSVILICLFDIPASSRKGNVGFPEFGAHEDKRIICPDSRGFTAQANAALTLRTVVPLPVGEGGRLTDQADAQSCSSPRSDQIGRNLRPHSNPASLGRTGADWRSPSWVSSYPGLVTPVPRPWEVTSVKSPSGEACFPTSDIKDRCRGDTPTGRRQGILVWREMKLFKKKKKETKVQLTKFEWPRDTGRVGTIQLGSRLDAPRLSLFWQLLGCFH